MTDRTNPCPTNDPSSTASNKPLTSSASPDAPSKNGCAPANSRPYGSGPGPDASAIPISPRFSNLIPRRTKAAIALGALGVAIFTLGTIGGHNDQPVQPVQVEHQEDGKAGDDASADVARQLGHPSLTAACKASDTDQALSWTCGIDTIERSGIPVADGLVIRYKPLASGENYGVKVWTGNPTSTAQYIAAQGLPPGVRVVTVQRDSWGTAEVVQ